MWWKNVWFDAVVDEIIKLQKHCQIKCTVHAPVQQSFEQQKLKFSNLKWATYDMSKYIMMMHAWKEQLQPHWIILEILENSDVVTLAE